MSASQARERQRRCRSSTTAYAGAIISPEIRVTVARPAASAARPVRDFSNHHSERSVSAIDRASVAPVER